MIYVALAEAAALVLIVSIFAGLLRSKERSHARREDMILDKLLHSVGRTWTPPPSEAPHTPEGETEQEWPTWTAQPEQEPVY